MASNFVKSSKMKRMESKKSHSWWWDSHISPKNSKWLQDNLEDMDQHVKRMLKLIEEDAESFAKKAEMYYQKRPELIHLVEEFYRIYRSLAERYDHVTGELRKNVQSDLQSQSSGISDGGSEPTSTIPSPDRKPSRRKSGPRAAGFDFFLGGGGSGSDLNNKEGDESSTLDSESESDDSSINNYSSVQSNDEDQGLRRKIAELEVELREVKEKLRLQEKEMSEGSFGKTSNENSEFPAKIVKCEEELQIAKQKILLSEEEITCLSIELQKYKVPEDSDVTTMEPNGVGEFQGGIGLEAEDLDSIKKIRALEEELKIAEDKLHESVEEVAKVKQELTTKDSSILDLQDQLKSAQRELNVWKNRLEREKREISKLQDRIVRYKTNLSDRDQEIRGLKEAISNANKSLSEENEQLKVEITKTLKERAYLEDNLKELDLRCQSSEEDLRRVKAGKEEAEAIFEAEIKQLKTEVTEKNGHLEELLMNLDALQLKYDLVISERENLSTRNSELTAEVSSKDDKIDEIGKHLLELNAEHAELIAGAEGARKLVEELSSKVKELEREVEKKEKIILEGAEEKREAIRQLCFSIEHYRNGYHRLRQVVFGHKRLPIMVS